MEIPCSVPWYHCVVSFYQNIYKILKDSHYSTGRSWYCRRTGIYVYCTVFCVGIMVLVVGTWNLMDAISIDRSYRFEHAPPVVYGYYVNMSQMS